MTDDRTTQRHRATVRGRRETADIDGADQAYRDGANVGGATGPVENAGAAHRHRRRTARRPTSSPRRR
jgi:hypothetical protein